MKNLEPITDRPSSTNSYRPSAGTRSSGILVFKWHQSFDTSTDLSLTPFAWWPCSPEGPWWPTYCSSWMPFQSSGISLFTLAKFLCECDKGKRITYKNSIKLLTTVLMLYLPGQFGWFDAIGTNCLYVTLPKVPSILSVARSFWVNSWNCLWGYCTLLGSLWLHNINRTTYLCHIALGIQAKSTIVIVSRRFCGGFKDILEIETVFDSIVLALATMGDVAGIEPNLFVSHSPRCSRKGKYCYCCKDIWGGFWGILSTVFDDAVLVLAALCDVTQIESNLSVSHSPR